VSEQVYSRTPAWEEGLWQVNIHALALPEQVTKTSKNREKSAKNVY
jgi:hypothetical protein